MPKGYWIGHVTVRDPEAYRGYVEANSEVVARFGGRFLVRGGAFERREGEARERHVVIEFPDMDAARACYDSPDYQAIARIRFENAESDMILVEGA